MTERLITLHKNTDFVRFSLIACVIIKFFNNDSLFQYVAFLLFII